MASADVLILGAGPAGAIAALNLAPTRRVLLVERRKDASPRIGESLPPAARRLLTDMGLWESFLSEGHAPCFGNRAIWGGPDPVEMDFVRDLDGHGFHLDRARFEIWLRREAVRRGAALIFPAALHSIARDGDGWRVRLSSDRGVLETRVSVLVDAGGRSAPLSRRLGARRTASDKLVCGWVHGHCAESGPSAGTTYIEAEPDGWWYSAPLPAGRRVLAFHTDADLPAARVTHDRDALLARARSISGLSGVLEAAMFLPDERSGFTAAHSAVTSPYVGDGWLAVGDAASSFDPLSSQGLLNALFTGLAAAEAIERHLEGDADAIPGHARALEGIWAAYERHLRLFYAQEIRWPDRPFWQRRRGALHLTAPAPERALPGLGRLA
ncbi:FAD-dependent monooxygenase [Polyangium aurulentum]|uniref:FAD-dependent monooxygenase n=1 Tax=Polyangium aurulentum TaxID=2567896 RepID=UPI0010AEBF77|nr:FAD-dependent monooxygenase [Polyangium aurulentum]UQA56864.1 tryptophan 7-halogenase [Polyangium aurulentum]